MSEIRLKVSDLFEIEPQTADLPQNFAAITAYVLKHYAFLPKPIAVTLGGDEVVISYPEEANWKKGTEHINRLELFFKDRDHLSEKWETLKPDGTKTHFEFELTQSEPDGH